MKIYDSIFIDLDGPILDGKYRHYNCYRDIIKKFGGVPLDIETYWEMKRERKDLKVILSYSNINASSENFKELWIQNIEEDSYLKYDKLKPEIINSILRFKTKADNIYLVTMRSNEKNLFKQLDNLRLSHLFDKIVICNYIKNQSKYSLLKNEPRTNAIFIGDTEVDLEAARLLNVKFIGIINGLRNSNFFIGEETCEELYLINI